MFRITSIDDPRIAAYRELKDRDVARHGPFFIAEGEHVVCRLLTSDYPTESVLLDEKRVEQFAPQVPANVPIYCAPASLMTQIIGFRFHSGIIACGKRKPAPTLEELLSPLSRLIRPAVSESNRQARPDAPRYSPFVLCPDLNNAENLGGIIRLCAGFGARALILGPHSVDPFWRQSIRVSMGTVFRLPIVRSTNLLADIELLRDHNIPTFATVVDGSAESLDSITPPSNSAILFGSEAHGLPPGIVRACDHKITIPMRLGTDSLNVAVAAGVILFHFTKTARNEPDPSSRA